MTDKQPIYAELPTCHIGGYVREWRSGICTADEAMRGIAALAAQAPVTDLQNVHDAVTVDLLNERVAYLEAKLKEAQAPQQAAPLPLLVRDIAADFGVTPMQVISAADALCLGKLSVNMAVTPELAKGLRKHFEAAPQQEVQEPTNEMYRAAQKIVLPYDDDGGTIILNTSQIRAIWQAMIAAAAPKAPQQTAPAVASKAVLTAIRDANLQLVRTGDDAFMLVTLKQAAPQQEVQEGYQALHDLLYVAQRSSGLQQSSAITAARIQLSKLGKAQPAPSGDASLPPSYLGSVLGCSLHGNSVTFNFGDRDEAERWHDAVADAWDAARKEGK